MSNLRRSRESLSLPEARRVALAAQGFGRPRPGRDIVKADVVRTVRALGLLQIDSVNVLVRSHYLPLFSRLGAYATPLLDAAAYGGRRRQVFEYWGHEASLLPVECQPLLRWRMQRAKNGDGTWGNVARFGHDRAAFCAGILAEIRDRGPLGVSEIGTGDRRKGSWWGWSEGKIALEWLFWTGQITTHSRRRFERVYDLTERVLPQAVVDAPTPAVEDAHRDLLRIASVAMGVATERDLRDYFRLGPADAKARVAELVESRDLVPVQVEGWKGPAYMAAGTRVPAHIEACALLSPFDSLVWFRDRLQRLFDFHYRIEIYTPAHKRIHGYYVLPFLLNERLVARVDLKSDREAGKLRVIATHYEPDADRRTADDSLRGELDLLARWLGLAAVVRGRARKKP
ncbi:MAG: winged helix-turn-helix domain-containing protein [Proteobacteria bacterium]|nr:winged helix-turn-helix domain-containing protein [Pseudomonadota bacterium]